VIIGIIIITFYYYYREFCPRRSKNYTEKLHVHRLVERQNFISEYNSDVTYWRKKNFKQQEKSLNHNKSKPNNKSTIKNEEQINEKILKQLKENDKKLDTIISKINTINNTIKDNNIKLKSYTSKESFNDKMSICTPLSSHKYKIHDDKWWYDDHDLSNLNSEIMSLDTENHDTLSYSIPEEVKIEEENKIEEKIEKKKNRKSKILNCFKFKCFKKKKNTSEIVNNDLTDLETYLEKLSCDLHNHEISPVLIPEAKENKIEENIGEKKKFKSKLSNYFKFKCLEKNLKDNNNKNEIQNDIILSDHESSPVLIPEAKENKIEENIGEKKKFKSKLLNYFKFKCLEKKLKDNNNGNELQNDDIIRSGDDYINENLTECKEIEDGNYKNELDSDSLHLKSKDENLDHDLDVKYERKKQLECFHEVLAKALKKEKKNNFYKICFLCHKGENDENSEENSLSEDIFIRPILKSLVFKSACTQTSPLLNNDTNLENEEANSFEIKNIELDNLIHDFYKTHDKIVNLQKKI
jgi:hypothetical protein